MGFVAIVFIVLAIVVTLLDEYAIEMVCIVAFLYSILLLIGCVLSPIGIILSVIEGDVESFFRSMILMGLVIFAFTKYKNTDLEEISESKKELGLLDFAIITLKMIFEERALSKHSDNAAIDLYEQSCENKKHIKEHSDWKRNIEIEVESQYFLKNELVENDIKKINIKNPSDCYNNSLMLYQKYKGNNKQ